MPVTLSFDIEQTSITDPNDRMRIELAFRRLGWEHIGGSSWRYPRLGASEHPSEDWFNHVIPALAYFRAIVSHANLNVTSFTLDAHSEAGYRSAPTAPIGQRIIPGRDIQMYAPGLAETTERILSEARLRQFFEQEEASL